MLTTTNLAALRSEEAALAEALAKVRSSMQAARSSMLEQLHEAEEEVKIAMALLNEANAKVAQLRSMLELPEASAKTSKSFEDLVRAALMDPVTYQHTPNVNMKATAEKHGLNYTAFATAVRKHGLIK